MPLIRLKNSIFLTLTIICHHQFGKLLERAATQIVKQSAVVVETHAHVFRISRNVDHLKTSLNYYKQYFTLFLKKKYINRGNTINKK